MYYVEFSFVNLGSLVKKEFSTKKELNIYLLFVKNTYGNQFNYIKIYTKNKIICEKGQRNEKDI